MQFRLRPVQPRVSQQLFDQCFQLADIAVQRLRFCGTQVIAHLQPVTQAHQRRAKLVGYPVNQLLFTGDQRVNIVGHLVKRHAEPRKARRFIKMNALIQMPFAEPLRRGLKAQHLLPVRAYPDKHRQRQRNRDQRNQGDIQQPHLVQEIEIGYRADRQHIVAARDPLDKCIFIVQRHNLAFAQAAAVDVVKVILIQRLDTQLKRQVQIQFFNGFVPLMRRDFTQFAAHQVERAFHQVIQRLTPGALGGELIDQPNQHRHYQKADKQQQIELYKEFFHDNLSRQRRGYWKADVVCGKCAAR